MLDKKAQTMYDRTLLNKRILRANGEEQNATISANKSGGCRNGHPPILAVANNLLIPTGNREDQRRKCEQSNLLEMPDFTGFAALKRSARSSEENGKNDLLSERPRVRIVPESPGFPVPHRKNDGTWNALGLFSVDRNLFWTCIP